MTDSGNPVMLRQPTQQAKLRPCENSMAIEFIVVTDEDTQTLAVGFE